MIKVNNCNSRQTFTGMGKLVAKNKEEMFQIQSAIVEYAETNGLLLGSDKFCGLLNRTNGTDMFLFSNDHARQVKNTAKQYSERCIKNRQMPDGDKIYNIKLAAAFELQPLMEKANNIFNITKDNVSKLPEFIEKIISA